MAIYLNLGMVVVGGEIGRRDLRFQNCGGKCLTLVASSVACWVQLMIDGMTDFFHQHGLNRLTGGALGVVGIEVDDRGAVYTLGREGTECTLKLGGRAQLNADRQRVVAHRCQQLLSRLLPVGGRRGLSPIEKREKLFTHVREGLHNHR